SMIERLQADRVDLVVLAGYMQILSARLIDAFAGRIINVHPSLLPTFPGLRAIERALVAGVTETGVTVHHVDEGVDTGPVIAQQALAIEPGDTPESLAERIHAIEHRLLPSVIAEIAAARRQSASGKNH
ncbi:MAG: phosphoribosylglycinamide formyltransferase, partial [Thermoleophilia bacterium]|nr:phosphoribosylglycinamide formyltransferase [Thermoleophilia bacterium]